MEFISKKLCIYSDMFTFQSPQSALHLMQYTYQDVFFFSTQNSFWAVDFDSF